ncbi:conserved hypothetical protein [Candidatus Sulfopaludibacter sp. SbA3]|nr:conserved hypothetical protein [Candidatus Sulfopaludibacter sp. SbA3]
MAGLNLEQLRTSPWYAKLPRTVATVMEPFRGARLLLAAYSGKDLLVIASGPSGLALSGSAESTQAAEAQRKMAATGAPELLADAESIAAGKQIWVVVRGDAALPLSGNAANVNRLLRNMEFAAITVRLDSTIEFAIVARGRTVDAARHFEETLRAALTMAAAADAKQAEMAALLRSIQVRREDRVVRAAVSAGGDAAEKLLAWLTP